MCLRAPSSSLLPNTLFLAPKLTLTVLSQPLFSRSKCLFPLPNPLCLLLNPSSSPKPLIPSQPQNSLFLWPNPLFPLSALLLLHPPSPSLPPPSRPLPSPKFPLPDPLFLLSSALFSPAGVSPETRTRSRRRRKTPRQVRRHRSPRAARAAGGSSGRCVRAGAAQEGAEPGRKRPCRGKEKEREKGQDSGKMVAAKPRGWFGSAAWAREQLGAEPLASGAAREPCFGGGALSRAQACGAVRGPGSVPRGPGAVPRVPPASGSPEPSPTSTSFVEPPEVRVRSSSVCPPPVQGWP